MKVPSPWVAVPLWLVASERLTPQEKLVFLYLLALRQSERGLPRKASIRAVSLGVHVARETTRAALCFFVDSRIVERDYGGFRLVALTQNEPKWRMEFVREPTSTEKPQTEERICASGSNLLELKARQWVGARKPTLAELFALKITKRQRARPTTAG